MCFRLLPANWVGPQSGLTKQRSLSRTADREAQRNIRERNKALVEELRAKIAALESQQPYQDLQAVLRAKEAVEAENVDIKRRLISIMSMIQPIVTSPGLSNLYLCCSYGV